MCIRDRDERLFHEAFQGYGLAGQAGEWMVGRADDGQRIGGKWNFLQLFVGHDALDQTDIQLIFQQQLCNLFGIIYRDLDDGLRIAFHKTGNNSGQQEAGQSHTGDVYKRQIRMASSMNCPRDITML